MPFQGANETSGYKPQGEALGYVRHWAFFDIIGCGSAIQSSSIAFALHDNSARPC